MPQKLSKASVRLADSIIASAENIGNLSHQIDPRKVRTLVSRAAIPITPDGYPSSSMPEATSGGSTSDPTLGTVLAKEKTRRDPVQSDLRQLYRDLEDAESKMRSALGRLAVIDQKIEEKVKREVSTPCIVCMQLPATKTGFCPGDHLDWWRYGSPDRAIWVMYRRKERNSEGKLLVEECPPPAKGCVAHVGPHRATVQENGQET